MYAEVRARAQRVHAHPLAARACAHQVFELLKATGHFGEEALVKLAPVLLPNKITVRPPRRRGRNRHAARCDVDCARLGAAHWLPHACCVLRAAHRLRMLCGARCALQAMPTLGPAANDFALVMDAYGFVRMAGEVAP